jgi:NADH-quinone oxidoreductase subunit F
VTSPAVSSVQSTFRQLQERALRHWHEVYEGDGPAIMVGTATCGRAAGSLEVLEAFKDELARQEQEGRVIEVGCAGHCYAEPLVFIKKRGQPAMVYGYVTPEIARRLVRDYVMGDDFSLEFTLGALEVNEMVPSIQDLPRFAHERRAILENCGFIDPEDLDQ